MVVDYLRSDITAGLKLSVKTNEIDIYMNEKFNTCVAVERGRASELMVFLAGSIKTGKIQNHFH